MTTEQWERENQDTLMEYFIDGDPSVCRIQCEYCRKIIYTQTRNRKYCSFQTCGHKMLNLRKSLKKRAERGTYTCACCGEQFLPIRADARYCSNAAGRAEYLLWLWRAVGEENAGKIWRAVYQMRLSLWCGRHAEVFASIR